MSRWKTILNKKFGIVSPSEVLLEVADEYLQGFREAVTDGLSAKRNISDSIVTLYWRNDIRHFEDEGGFVVWNVFEMITPNDLYLFLLNKDYLLVNHRALKGVVCELIWPLSDEETY